MKILLVFVFYGLVYYVFENLFNFLTIDLLDKNKTWGEKLKLKSSISCSFWMIPIGALIGLILYLYFLIPFNMSNIFFFILAGLFGGMLITSIELGSGILLNRILKLNLWDYSKSKINYLGQIELFHSLGWIGITYLFYFINLLFKGL